MNDAATALRFRLQRHDFHHEMMGGSCTAYVRTIDRGDGRGVVETVITVDGTNDAPECEDDEVMVGEYQGEDTIAQWFGRLGDYLMVLDVLLDRLGPAARCT